MIRRVFTGILLVAIIAIGGLIFRQLSNRTPAIGGFKNGVVLHPNSQLLPIESVIDDQLQLIDQLGAGWVKTDHITKLGNSYNDAIVKSAKTHHLNLMFIIDWQLQDIEPFKEENIENRAYEVAFTIANRYKGRVHYYQVSSEPGGLVLKSPLLNGMNTSQYDPARYEKIKKWLKGTLRGIGDADSTAKRVLVGQYLHTGFFDLLDRDGLTPLYEVIGWDLYSDVGTDLAAVATPNGNVNLLEKLLTFKKELLLTEVARRDGTSDGKEAAVGDYVTQVFEKLKDTPIKGLFIYELTDQPAIPGTQAHYGLVGLDKNSDGSFRLGKKKQGFASVKKLFTGR